jgi:hypothetical protein
MTRDLQLLSPTERFCSRTISAHSYLDEIEAVFTERAAQELKLDMFSDFKDIRTAERVSDYNSFVTEMINNFESGAILDVGKGLNMLHLHNPVTLLTTVSALVKQVESKVILFRTIYLCQ